VLEECLICAKHRDEGPLAGGARVWEDDDVVVFHRPPDASGTAFLGYLFVETKRHVAYVDGLTDAEARAVGWAVSRAARALRSEVDAEHVFSVIAGRGVAHFHQHVLARYRGTPTEVGWMDGDEWTGAPRGGKAEIEELATRLARGFES